MWILHGGSSWLLFFQSPRCPYPTTSPVSVLPGQWCYISSPIYSVEHWENKGGPHRSSRLWKMYFILGVKCKLNPACCSRLSLLAIQASGARRQSFPSNVYNTVGSSHLQKDSRWIRIQSCSGSSPRCSFSQQQPPKARQGEGYGHASPAMWGWCASRRPAPRIKAPSLTLWCNQLCGHWWWLPWFWVSIMQCLWVAQHDLPNTLTIRLSKW